MNQIVSYNFDVYNIYRKLQFQPVDAITKVEVLKTILTYKSKLINDTAERDNAQNKQVF